MRRSVLALCLPFSLTAVKAVAQSAPAADLGRVEITSNRDNDTQQRRESTASKIVIGREEIERQGDANVGEILKRMPGISVGGVGLGVSGDGQKLYALTHSASGGMASAP